MAINKQWRLINNTHNKGNKQGDAIYFIFLTFHMEIVCYIK